MDWSGAAGVEGLGLLRTVAVSPGPDWQEWNGKQGHRQLRRGMGVEEWLGRKGPFWTRMERYGNRR